MNKSIFFVCGVSGAGKSTIAQYLSERLDIPYHDGDDYHPEANIAKMEDGKPLNDDDRQGWLERINQFIKKENKSLIFACSALKEDYRIVLAEGIEHPIHWIFLDGDFDTILERINTRKNHFMPSHLLQSQFDILDIPSYAIVCDIANDIDQIINNIITKTNMQNKKQLGLIGLGVMGKSLARNFADKGVGLSLYNRFVAGKEEQVAEKFIHQYEELSNAEGHENLEHFVRSLAQPRTVFLMVTAGAATDSTIDVLIPLLDAGDLIIDGGNSHYKLTQERNDKLSKHDIYFIGTGVSGGEEGALKGPSIMPGGEPEAYNICKASLESIAAKDKDDNACCGHIGKGGAGHFVKMVHNGIEYAEMQFLAEIYGLLRFSAGYDVDFIASLFEQWSQTDLNSYLLEITIEVLRKKEGENHLIDIILDKAGNKGTGSWTTIAACELGVPVPTLTAALFARYQSSFKTERTASARLYGNTQSPSNIDLSGLAVAYKLARIINHHQGLHLITTASDTYEWNINLPEVARIWTNGCIIRSAFMEDLKSILSEESNILNHPSIVEIMQQGIDNLRKITAKATIAGAPVPCLSSALTYLESYMKEQSTANIIQGQRDYFGAHRYQRTDDPEGPSHHTIWN